MRLWSTCRLGRHRGTRVERVPSEDLSGSFVRKFGNVLRRPRRRSRGTCALVTAESAGQLGGAGRDEGPIGVIPTSLEDEGFCGGLAIPNSGGEDLAGTSDREGENLRLRTCSNDEVVGSVSVGHSLLDIETGMLTKRKQLEVFNLLEGSEKAEDGIARVAVATGLIMNDRHGDFLWASGDVVSEERAVGAGLSVSPQCHPVLSKVRQSLVKSALA